MKKIHNVFKQLSLIDKLVLVSLALLIISCIFGVLTFLFKDGILNSIFEFLLALAGISSLIGGYIFEERIIFSIILIVISVILQIIALDLYMNTPIGINKSKRQNARSQINLSAA